MTQLVFEKRISSAWIGVDLAIEPNSSFLDGYRACLSEFHDWGATIVGCHLDETAPIAEFFIIEDTQHAEYRLREVEGND